MTAEKNLVKLHTISCSACNSGISANQCRPRSCCSRSRSNSDMSRTRSCRSGFSGPCVFWTVLVVVWLTVLTRTADGFNLDTEKFVEFEGPRKGSYFGYSVAMVNIDERNKWLLFGAPKDNSSFLASVSQPGAIHKCTILQDGNGHNCEELFIDDATGPGSARFNGMNRLFVHGRDGQWLGASLDVQEDKGVVTCASRWYNVQFLDDGYYFMNGLCYELPIDMNRNNIRAIPALVDGRKQTTTIGNTTKINYGMGSLGSAVHYTQQGHDLILGAPGLRTWTGGFVDMRQTDVYFTEYMHKATEESEMLGYAITSGEYFGNGITYFAVGAPRDELMGKVYLYRGTREKYVIENADLILNGTEGEKITVMPVNSFYGAALCSCDVNKDGREDLLVAAPFYAHVTGKDMAVDEGIVMVYLGESDLTFNLQSEVLTGSSARYGRFGTAMACLGDINKDTYNDVVIGAPYEDDMQGAIYIYNGAKTGLWPRYTQRIPASKMAPGLTSFGISFSKPADMNNDRVNDIAVGAYLSDKGYLMFGQSVINMEMKLKTNVDLIDIPDILSASAGCPTSDGTSRPCFAVDVCLTYLNGEFPYIDIKLTLALDVYMEQYSRVAFLDNNKNVINVNNFRVFTSDNKCTTKLVYIKSTADLVTPVLIKASYTVKKIQNAIYIPPTINGFDGENPSSDPLVKDIILEFKKDCPDNQCNTDLMLSADAVFEDTNGYFVLGTPTMSLSVKISKSGDPSYSSNFFVAFPRYLQYEKVVKEYGDPDITCGYVNTEVAEEGEDATKTLASLINQNIPSVDDTEYLVGCSYGNPLYNDTGVSFNLIFRVPNDVRDPMIQFRLNTTTLSDEMNDADNVKTIDVGVRHKVSTELIGVSRPSFIRIDDSTDSYAMSHTYELRNRGPSSLPSAGLTIRYPQVQTGGGTQLYLNKTTWSCLPPCNISCTFTETPGSSPIVYSEEVGPTYYVKESPSVENIAESREMKTVRNVNCLTSSCVSYLCDLTDIPARESAVVTLEFYVAGNILDVISDGAARYAKSEGRVRLKATGKLITDVTSHYTDIPTQILPLSQPPQKLAWWIILLSVLGGILFIVILVLILWKCGFFRRKEREQMQAMQHTGEVEKMMPEDGEMS